MKKVLNICYVISAVLLIAGAITFNGYIIAAALGSAVATLISTNIYININQN